MSYDPQKTQTLIQASAAHRRMPNAEFVELLVNQLKAADEHMAVLSAESRNARTDLSQAKRDLLSEENLHRETMAELTRLRAERRPVPVAPPNPMQLADGPAAPESGSI